MKEYQNLNLNHTKQPKLEFQKCVGAATLFRSVAASILAESWHYSALAMGAKPAPQRQAPSLDNLQLSYFEILTLNCIPTPKLWIFNLKSRSLYS